VDPVSISDALGLRLTSPPESGRWIMRGTALQAERAWAPQAARNALAVSRSDHPENTRRTEVCTLGGFICTRRRSHIGSALAEVTVILSAPL
jgi:hypothetical protein